MQIILGVSLHDKIRGQAPATAIVPCRRLLMTGVLLAAFADAVHGAGAMVYRTYDSEPGKPPIYSDRPLGKASLPVTRIDGAVARSVSRSAPVSERRTVFDHIVHRAAQIQGVDASLVKAVIDIESGYRPEAISPKGAVGLMQVMPATAARYGTFNLAVPEQNIEVGTRHLRNLLVSFGGDVRLALAAYNAGEQAVRNHGFRIPPYPETIRYVPMVLERYRQYKEAGRINPFPSLSSARIQH
ncbi:MAG TPA: lytic transglycosylase domain-containing protein [Noviherbaspirillum sp.]|nr:lytic transglycosylase domain-containing protein [Noviherbaspirillum sp.]